jgi:hypothetical protein
MTSIPTSRIVAALLAAFMGLACSSGDQATIPWCHDRLGYGAVEVGARFAGCPEVTSYVVTPLRIGPGETAQLSGTAKDSDSSNLSYAWIPESGMVANPTSSVTSYQCGSVGIVKLTFIVSDGRCEDSVEAAIECVQ